MESDRVFLIRTVLLHCSEGFSTYPVPSALNHNHRQCQQQQLLFKTKGFCYPRYVLGFRGGEGARRELKQLTDLLYYTVGDYTGRACLLTCTCTLFRQNTHYTVFILVKIHNLWD